MQWYYWVIQEVEGTPITVNLPHPMHLHGHDFWILGTGVGQFSDVGISALNFENPTRRDTEMLPAGGWLVVAFNTDNPGAWLFHCHICEQPSLFNVCIVDKANEEYSLAFFSGHGRPIPRVRRSMGPYRAAGKQYQPRLQGLERILSGKLGVPKGER